MKKNIGSVKVNRTRLKPSEYAFSTNVQDVLVGSRVRTISCDAFFSCRCLEKVAFSDGVTQVGDRAFGNCTSLDGVILPDSLKYLGEYVFKDCTEFRRIKLPDSLEYLPKGAFQNCRALEKIILPTNLKKIGDECFSGCVNLKEIVFGGCLESIGKKAFKRCGNLTRASLPSSLVNIGDFAFMGCKSLEYVKLNSTPATLGRQPFPGCVCNESEATDFAFVSSFAVDGDEGECPVISVNGAPAYMALGFEGLLSDFGKDNRKTCYNHILALNRSSVKLFVGENYYSFNNDSDYIIENGEFNYLKYDKQFSKATDYEKPYIAAYRLAYDNSLSDEYREIYIQALRDRAGEVAVFATRRNEVSVLSYLLEKCDFDTDFCFTLYNIALKNGNRNLLDIIPVKSQKTGFTETENLFSDLL